MKMDFLNIGSGELVFLILLAILLVGPKRAVEWVQQASRFAARIRQEWLAVQRDVIREVQAIQQDTAAALRPTIQEVSRDSQAVQQEGAEAVQSLQEVAREIRAFQEQVVPLKIPQPTDDFAG
jgi:Sec-independent protein translocase protein TatA